MTKNGLAFLVARKRVSAATPAIAREYDQGWCSDRGSGYLAVVDQGGRDGIKMAVDEVNAAGGVGGKKRNSLSPTAGRTARKPSTPIAR